MVSQDNKDILHNSETDVCIEFLPRSFFHYVNFLRVCGRPPIVCSSCCNYYVFMPIRYSKQ